MRRAKATFVAAVAAVLVLGGGIVALAVADNDAKSSGSAHGAAAPAAGSLAAVTTPSGPACGTATQATVAAADALVAHGIYAGEEHSSETTADRHQIESFGPLLSALRAGDDEAVRSAVHELVYSGTHIVRLRVGKGPRLIADIGGPYILAPVTGSLRSGGQTIARFSFSVQDDAGYIKLVNRFIGIPVVLRTPQQGQLPVEGQPPAAPRKIPDRGPVKYLGATVEAYSFTVGAYPQGTLRVSLLSPHRPGLATSSCGQVRATEMARVALHVARRFKTLTAGQLQPYAGLVNALTGARVIIKAGGHTYLAGGSTVPHKLPTSGTVTIGGKTYYAAVVQLPGGAREYVLVPA